ncbi:MAG: cytochrome-c oxidase, cbb3-type subunit I [Candidatus Kapabacteria bacterium]|nr:cytochrome-c oxidase, cbb3-type subunit I [Ignavibacteriota bacterium]MCW5885331.1 cytochrome-c oxidase, cbb3-type subunit I [Candidatus Kapabacteria bacterium]
MAQSDTVNNQGTQLDTFSYDNNIVRLFTWATVLWGVVGFLVGLIIAIQLYAPAYIPWFDLGISWLSFGRLRPLHTNAVIFAFVGNAIFLGIYYSMPRLLKAAMWSTLLSKIHFWGWQLIIVSAAITFPLGLTQGKEYAELIWPIDVAIAIVWIVFGVNMFMTLIKRREKHMYVAIWFYIASWVTVTVLHVVNSLAIPTGFLHSYPIYAGVQDALVQWWYGHNAVAFFLTTPFLGLMYYFLPKAADRPVYSYKLSIIHFWSLIFLYIWAGPHHLLYSSLPDWAQSLGTVFSIMLIAPSWGGMINGLLTLRGVWDKVREEPILKFMVVAITAYGMATFEGPMLSIKSVNALSHFTDWTIAHVHVGALGWNGMLTFAILYWIVPKLWNTKIYSKKLANMHFWISTIGILVYAIPVYWAGITQGLMWKQFSPEGFLLYRNFLETVTHLVPMYLIRSFGGLLFLTGSIIMVWNLLKTAKMGTFVAFETVKAAPLHDPGKDKPNHRWLEGKPVPFIIATLIVVLIGGLFEIIPLQVIKSNVPTIASVKPYTPLELIGRDIYIAEGCYTCHSQLIRPFRSETERYGEYSKAGEFVYDYPFQWGSKRTGPDLHRVGGKYPNAWHYQHMYDPQSISPGSIMPRYPWLLEDAYDISTIASKIRTMMILNVPYPDDYDKYANADVVTQAQEITDELATAGITTTPDKQIIALIAYLQRLGIDIKGETSTMK